MDLDVVSLFKQGGVALVALVMLAWVIKRIGERMIGSIDKLTERSDANTKTVADTLASSTVTITTSLNEQSHATVLALGTLTERVARIEGVALGQGAQGFEGEITPVEVPKRALERVLTPAQGNPSLPYGFSKPRPKTNG